jgi:uncharacterized damage-inducible protein DinB
MSHFPLMARFNEWVNQRVYDCVAQIPDDAYRADRKAFFGSIHRTLNHLLVVDRLWTGRITGDDRGIRSLDQLLYDEFAALRAAREEEDRQLIALVDRLEREGTARPVEYGTISDGNPRRMRARIDHILLGLFNHQTNHRGQVNTMLTQQGIVTPDLDVIYYLHEIGEARFV